MKIPKEVKTFCPNCKRHEVHKLKQFKAFGFAGMRTLSRGNRIKERGRAGYGGKYEFVGKVKKQTKKPTFVATCSVCKKQHYYVFKSKMKFSIA
jgi:large subunit ribosomal protein L44e